MYLFYMFKYQTWALTIVTWTISSLDLRTRTLVPLSGIITDIFGYYYQHPQILFPTFSGNIFDIIW